MGTNSQPSNRRENAQSMVEFALVLPLLLVLVLGIIEVGRLLFIYSAVATSSREAARYGSAAGDIGGYVSHYQDCNGMRAAAKRMGILVGIQDSDIAINYDEGNNASPFGSCPVGGTGSAGVDLGDRVVIRVNAQYQPILPLVSLPPFTISSISRRTILKDIFIEGTPPAPTTPTVRFATDGQAGDEDAGMLPVVVRLSSTAANSVTVPFSVGGTATTGDDYSLTPTGQVVIPAGSTTAEIRVNIVDDHLDEENELVVLAMGTPINANKGTPEVHVIRIIDNDDPPVVSFTTSSQSQAEGTNPDPDAPPTTIPVNVQLSGPSGKEIIVPFTWTSSTTADDDFSITASPLVFSPGEASKQILISVTPDSLDEDDDWVEMVMGAPTNATQGSPDQHKAWIVDDDNPPVVSFTWESQAVAETAGSAIVRVELSAPSGKQVEVPIGLSGTAERGNGKDYTIDVFPLKAVIPPGSASADVNIQILADVVEEEDETVVLTMGSPVNATRGTPYEHTLTITNVVPLPDVSFTTSVQSKSEDGGTLIVTVRLSTASTRDVTVPFTLGGTATQGPDYSIQPAGTIVIPAGGDNAAITVSLVNDVLDEDNETVVITMGTPTNANKTAPSVHTATIIDDETAQVYFTSSSQSKREDLGEVTIMAQLDIMSTKDVTVPFSLSGTATSGQDYETSPSPFVIPAGSMSALIQVTLVDDTLVEPDETAVVTMGTPTNAIRGSPSAYTVTILDNDGPTCDIFDDNELYLNSTDKIISWEIYNLEQDPLVLKSLTVEWPDEGPVAPKFDYVQFISTLIWDGNVTHSPETLSSWLGFSNDRMLLTSPTTVTLGFTRDLQVGDYTLTLIFYNQKLGIDCTPISRSRTLAP